MSVLGLLLSVVFAAFGAAIDGDEGAIVGLFIGYLLGATIQLTTKLSQLTKRFGHVEEELAKLKTEQITTAQPAGTPKSEEVAPTAPEPEVVPEPTQAAMQPIEVPQPTVTEPPSEPVTPTSEPEPARRRFQENAIDKVIAAVHHFFTDGNVVVKVGLLILFVGVGFLIKYASEHSLLPIEIRVAGVALLGIVISVFGWRLREKKRIYALLLQGGGVGILYLTVFGAAKLYGLLPIGFAFGIMVGLVVFSSILAILQDAKYLALYGAAGGFLAPILASTGSGSHVMLFSYYALLNVSIVAIAWYRSWRELNLLGFVFTFVIGSLWGASHYQPALFASVEPFLILFFIFFLAISVLFALRQPPNLKGYVDSTLVFGLPVIAFTLQSALVKDIPYGLAFSALSLSGIYILLASLLWRKGIIELRLLTESFLALGVVFGSLAIPLALDGLWTAAAWALEGAAIVWIGVRQHRLLARMFGVLLQFGSGYFFLADFDWPNHSWVVFNGTYLGALVISLSGFFISYYLYKHTDRIRNFEKPFKVILFVWALIWWFANGAHELLTHHLFDDGLISYFAAFIALSMLVAHFVERKLDWSLLRYPIYSQIVVMYLGLWVMLLFNVDHPFDDKGWLGWGLLVMSQYFFVYRYQSIFKPFVLRGQHLLSVWLVLILVAWEIGWWIGQIKGISDTWHHMSYVFVPGLLVWLLLRWGKRIAWPFATHYDIYISMAMIPVMAMFAIFAVMFGLLHKGDPWPVDYIPFVNPVDLLVGFLVYLLLLWPLTLSKFNSSLLQRFDPRYLHYAVAGIIFIWLNGIVARTVHHWLDVSHSINSLSRSVEFQASISIMWTIVALLTMMVASRKQQRQLWFVGLGLFIIVAMKLFLFDIAANNALVMSIAITVVGILAVIFGYYLSPLPPRQDKEKQV